MHRKRTLVRVRVAALDGRVHLHARRETLPGVVGLLPPAAAIERVCGTVEDVVEVLVDEDDTLVEASLVVTVQVGQVDLQPSETTFAERLALRELEETTTQIVIEMVQVGRNGVCASTEIDVVGQVYGVTKEL